MTPEQYDRFRGIWPALITPFNSDDQIDFNATRRLLARLIDQGAGGFYVCGSTGEAPLLRVQERKQFVDFVVGEISGQVPIIVHVGHTAPVEAVELARHANQPGVDAVASVPPPICRFTDM
jgi:N-acetylneuraminate lyase